MRTSESVKEIASALGKAQAKMNGVKRDATNPYFQSRYATLDACWNACKEHLVSNGIAVAQVPSIIGDMQVLTTRLLHSSGEWMEGDYILKPSKDDPQGMGSALTYARRYALCAMVGLCPEDDDDGNAASKNDPPPPQRAVAPSTNGKSKKPIKGGDDQDAKRKAAKQEFFTNVCHWVGCTPDKAENFGRRIMRAVVPDAVGRKTPLTAEEYVAGDDFISRKILDNVTFADAFPTE